MSPDALVVLASVVAGAITLGIVFIASWFTRDEPSAPPKAPGPDIITDPTTDLQEDLREAADDIARLDDDSLADAWADHAERAGD